MNWIDPNVKLPPQGKKILYLLDGDAYVVQRFSKYWLPIPFYDSQFSFLAPPTYWCDIDLPDELTGELTIVKDDTLYNLDDFELHHPQEYKIIIDGMISIWKGNERFKEKFQDYYMENIGNCKQNGSNAPKTKTCKKRIT